MTSSEDTGRLSVRVDFKGKGSQPFETVGFSFAPGGTALRMTEIRTSAVYNGEPPPGQPISYETRLDLQAGTLADTRSKKVKSVGPISRTFEEFDPWEARDLELIRR